MITTLFCDRYWCWIYQTLNITLLLLAHQLRINKFGSGDDKNNIKLFFDITGTNKLNFSQICVTDVGNGAISEVIKYV